MDNHAIESEKDGWHYAEIEPVQATMKGLHAIQKRAYDLSDGLGGLFRYVAREAYSLEGIGMGASCVALFSGMVDFCGDERIFVNGKRLHAAWM